MKTLVKTHDEICTDLTQEQIKFLLNKPDNLADLTNLHIKRITDAKEKIAARIVNTFGYPNDVEMVEYKDPKNPIKSIVEFQKKDKTGVVVLAILTVSVQLNSFPETWFNESALC